MSISQLARSAGVGVETVRYYQRRGLLPDPRPQKTGTNGIRHYGPDEARRLRFIRSAQNAGFTLEEIAELDRKIAELEKARKALSKLARECAAGDKGPCPIIASFEGTSP